MKLIQIVFSPAGGTKKTAALLAAGLAPEAEEYIDLTDPALDPAAVMIPDDALVLLAAPSYGGRVPALAARRIAHLQAAGAKCVTLCVYGNRAYEDTLLELCDLAEACGLQTVAAVAAVAEHSILHQYAAGRPDAQDAAELAEIARKIRAKLQEGDSSPAAAPPGKRPYKKAGAVGLTPKADAKCSACGRCAAACPAQAIDPASPRTADAAKCISCMRCVAVCPQQARKINGLLAAAAAQAIKKAASQRKGCELYI